MPYQKIASRKRFSLVWVVPQERALVEKMGFEPRGTLGASQEAFPGSGGMAPNGGIISARWRYSHEHDCQALEEQGREWGRVR